MASPPNVNNVLSLAKIVQIQLHALAVSALLLQERGHPAPVPVVYYIYIYSGKISLNKYYCSKGYYSSNTTA